LYGYVRDTFVNMAVNKTLARALFRTVCAAKARAYGDGVVLAVERVTVRPEGDRLDGKRQLEREGSTAAQAPNLYVGAVASGDMVIKLAAHRDKIAAKEKVIAFEIEGAGI
jgi:nucleoside phosphorylase